MPVKYEPPVEETNLIVPGLQNPVFFYIITV